MKFSHEKTTCIGFGSSTLADAFQAGRDAAQMAQNQTPGNSVHLALAIGPSGLGFNDFIEGVRLVTGEKALIGIPAPWVLFNEALNTQSRAVILISSQDQSFLPASTPLDPNPLVMITSLLTELKSRRGDGRQDFDSHGVIAIDNMDVAQRQEMTLQLSADVGIESWIVGFSLWPGGGSPMIVGPHMMSHGLSAIECLGDGPWGIGWVETAAFRNNPGVLKEASRAAVKDATSQMHPRMPGACLLLVANHMEPPTESIARDIFSSASTAIPGVPMVAIPIHSPYLRGQGRNLAQASEGIIALMVPQ